MGTFASLFFAGWKVSDFPVGELHAFAQDDTRPLEVARWALGPPGPVIIKTTTKAIERVARKRTRRTNCRDMLVFDDEAVAAADFFCEAIIASSKSTRLV